MWLFMLSYFIARPLLTLVTEGSRALCMLTWSRQHLVQLHLGSYGHNGGLNLRIGRLVLRIHPYVFLLRGAISDTHVLPRRMQFAFWCVLGMAVDLLLFVLCLMLVWYGDLPSHLQIGMAVLGFLSFLDLGFAVFREMEPVVMQCGVVYVGPFATLRVLSRYGKKAIAYMQGLRCFLREDYGLAVGYYEEVAVAGYQTVDLLEDLAYAQLAVGQSLASLESYEQLCRTTIPNATQIAVAAMAHWHRGEYTQAIDLLDAAIHLTPGHAIARNYRAWMQIQLGIWPNALHDLLIATQNNSEYAVAYANMALGHIHARDPEKAFASAEKAYKLDPTDIHVLRVYAQVLDHADRQLEARRVREHVAIFQGSMI